MWTQKPPTFGGQKGQELEALGVRSSLLGVGRGQEEQEARQEQEYVQSSSSLRLASFLRLAGQAMVTLLEEEQARREGAQVPPDRLLLLISQL